MKLKTLIICSTLLFTNIAFAGPDHGEHKPMKGGVLATVKGDDVRVPHCKHPHVHPRV